jgi:hypothetical protein
MVSVYPVDFAYITPQPDQAGQAVAACKRPEFGVFRYSTIQLTFANRRD